jgi:hypothetical protein
MSVLLFLPSDHLQQDVGDVLVELHEIQVVFKQLLRPCHALVVLDVLDR